jgi:glycosyltransferase involved in cell wall biosynthesis
VKRVPLVSVVTAAFNAEAFIRETVDSVLAQKYPRLEYIVVDDGSTDRTRDLVAEYATQSRLRLLEQPNRGEAVALNSALEAASGDYVLAVSADDPIHPELLDAAIALLESEPSLAAVYPDWEIINDRSQVISAVRVRDYALETMVLQHLCLPGPGTVIRRSALDGMLFRDPALTFKNDFDLWLRLAARFPLRRLPGVLASWRRHSAGATSAKRGKRMAEEHLAVIERFFNLPGIPERILSRKDLAFSTAHYAAGLQALHSPEVNGKDHMIRSLRLAPLWPTDFYPEARRSWSRVGFVLASPASRWAHNVGLAAGLPLPRG